MEIDNSQQDSAAKSKPAKKEKKIKPPEKRLFHKPITPVKIIIYCVFALLLIGVAFAGRFVYATLIDKRAAFSEPPERSVEKTPEPTQTLSPEELLALQADRDFMKDRANILLTGIDFAEEREGREDFRTDTMMLFSVNFATNRVDIISVPRDSYADIAFTDNNWKINGAFMSAGGAEGNGFDCLLETVSMALGGIPVDYYFAVDMDSVKEIVDIIGGVWYDVDYEVNIGGRQLSTGYQLLDGQAFLDYSRIRKGITSGTDIDRIDRQQRLLLEVFKQLKSADLFPKIPEIYNKVKDKVYTNLNFEQIAALSFFALDLDMENGLNRYALKGKYLQYKHMYYVIDHTYTQEIIMEIFGVEADINWKYSLAYAQADMAGMAFDASLKKLQSFLKTDPELSKELSSKASSKIKNWKKLRGNFSKKVSSAGKSNRKVNTKEIDAATKEIDSLYAQLAAYKPEPSPSPSAKPEPSPSAKPEPSASAKPEPSSSPSASPSASPKPTADDDDGSDE